ncbi:hypothetical protein VL15_37925 [Burkholderia cepacia]|uniref:PrgH/EprH family type III secretion apparatus protein n=2 Tax=Burkholderia cepacia TaxID=292 RepID=A0A0J5W4S6_BURCE|nr:hypothetical protein VL15_37925 [Burkholderia cepacia]
MRGTEYPLPVGRTQFVTYDETGAMPEADMVALHDDAIFLPTVDGAGRFFDISLAQIEDGTFSITIPGTQTEDTYHDLNTVVTVCGQNLAVRAVVAEWSEGVVAFLSTKEIAPRHLQSERRRTALVRWIPGVAIATLIATGGGWYLVHNSSSDAAHVTDLQTALGRNDKPLQILYAGPKSGYVIFAPDNREANWARQALVRNPVPYPTRITTVDREVQRIASELDKAMIGYYGIRLTNAAKPVVILSRDRNSSTLFEPEGTRKLRGWLLSLMPYARDVIVDVRSDAEIDGIARDALTDNGIPYIETRSTDGVTFRFTGSLTDAELDRITRVANHFHSLWGSGYVHFVVDLKDDWLKGKSFMYGSDGYVKLGVDKWYFPSPLKPGGDQ